MNKNLRIVVATAVMLWCGLGMGTINASVMQSVFSPVGIENPAVDSVIISMGGINNNAVFDRVSLPSPDHPGAIAAITGDPAKKSRSASGHVMVGLTSFTSGNTSMYGFQNDVSPKTNFS